MFCGKRSNVAVQLVSGAFVDRPVMHIWQKRESNSASQEYVKYSMFMVCDVGDGRGCICSRAKMHLWQKK